MRGVDQLSADVDEIADEFGLVDADGNLDSRPCTCHPDDDPPNPCAKRYALSECKKVHAYTLAALYLPTMSSALLDEELKKPLVFGYADRPRADDLKALGLKESDFDPQDRSQKAKIK